MGSGRDKRKKQKGKTPGVGAEKTGKCKLLCWPLWFVILISESPPNRAHAAASKTAHKQAKRAAKACKVRCRHTYMPPVAPAQIDCSGHVHHLGMQDENEDLDALLEQFALDDEAKSTVQVIEDCNPPSARVFASFTPVPLAVRTPCMSHDSILLCGVHSV